MKIDELIQTLENKKQALEKKKEAAIQKGSLELYNIFDEQLGNLSLTLARVKKSASGYSEEEKDYMKKTVLENLPNLALYFKKKSIHEAVAGSIDSAFNQMEDRQK